MRYYYYGNTEEDMEPKDKTYVSRGYKKFDDGIVQQDLPETQGKTEIYGDLVIEEDTVYEIDRECLRCHEEAQNKR